MKKTYADLHLYPDLADSQQALSLIRKAAALGYNLISMGASPSTSKAKLEETRRLCSERGLDFCSRVDLRPRSPQELLRSLRRLRRNFELVAVMCESKPVARQAAKDRRVDLLSFPRLDFHQRFFDSAEAELASQSLAAFEIDVRLILTLEGRARTRLLSSLHREVQTAMHFKVPIVVSSGVSQEILMRRPLELAALSSLFGLKEACEAETVSKNPVSIVKRNRDKLDWRFVAPGIRIIRRGKDC